jgi:hypothetical protein
MLKRVLAGLMAAAFVVVLLPATATAQGMKDMKKPEYKNVTIRGTVIDVSCKFGHGLSGKDHRMCTQVCADKGIPLAILTSEGDLYIPVSADMPGGTQNALLKEHAEHLVEVTGKTFRAGGAHAIQISEVKKGYKS